MTDEFVPADFPGLASLCWNRNPARPIERETAWALYRANWGFIWQDELSDEERALIESLEVEFGKGERLLGTDGPPPMAGREITPEEAAEILGIVLSRRSGGLQAGRGQAKRLDGRNLRGHGRYREARKRTSAEDVVRSGLSSKPNI